MRKSNFYLARFSYEARLNSALHSFQSHVAFANPPSNSDCTAKFSDTNAMRKLLPPYPDLHELYPFSRARYRCIDHPYTIHFAGEESHAMPHRTDSWQQARRQSAPQAFDGPRLPSERRLRTGSPPSHYFRGDQQSVNLYETGSCHVKYPILLD